MKSYQIWISYYLLMIYTLIELSVSYPLGMSKEHGMCEIIPTDQVFSSEPHDHVNNLVQGDGRNSGDLKRENEVFKPSYDRFPTPSTKNEAPERMKVPMAPKNDDLIIPKDQLKKDDQTQIKSSKEIKKSWLQKTLDLILIPYNSIKSLLKWVRNRIHSLRLHSNETNQKVINKQNEEPKMMKTIKGIDFDEFKDGLSLKNINSVDPDEVEHSELVGTKGEDIIATMRSRKKSISPQMSMLSRLSRPEGEIKDVITQEDNEKKSAVNIDHDTIDFPGFNRKRKHIDENENSIKKSKSFSGQNIENNSVQNSIDQPMLSLGTKISDTKILDTKISGRTDVNPIQGYIEIFADPKLDIHQRINAGKELEELLQVLDNTKDLEFLGAWPKLVKLLEEPHHLIQSHTLWIIGTAVQDNPKSQSSFLKYDPIPLIINILNHSSHEETQAKALYCLSSTLKHVPSSSTAFTSFISASGFEALNTILKGPSMKLRIRTAVSINSLAMQPHSILQSLPSHHLFKTLLNSVSPTRGIPTGVNGEGLLQDDDYIERALRAITTIVLKSDPTELDTEEKQKLKELIESMSEKDIRLNRLEGAGVAESEWDSVLERIN